MTYKEAISRFKTQYNIYCRINKLPEPKLDNTEILMFLSIPYSDICNMERLIQPAPKSLTLVAGQSEYTSGAGASNIPANLLDVISVKYDEGGDNETKLDRVEIDNIPGGTLTGIPEKWTIIRENANKIFKIYPTPTSAETAALKIYYYQKIFPYSGTAENTFSDVNFETAANYGGSFLNDTLWDNEIILATIMYLTNPEMYQLKYGFDKSKKPTFVGSKVGYSFGAASEDL